MKQVVFNEKKSVQFRPEKLDDVVCGMKALGDILMQYNFPQKPFDPEDPIGIFKLRNIVVDGYAISVHYQRSDYGIYRIKTLQIQSRGGPFLPFCVVCKIASKFLGDQDLSLIETVRENRKLYIWSHCADKEDKSVKIPSSESLPCVYRGLSFSRLEAHQNLHEIWRPCNFCERTLTCRVFCVRCFLCVSQNRLFKGSFASIYNLVRPQGWNLDEGFQHEKEQDTEHGDRAPHEARAA